MADENEDICISMEMIDERSAKSSKSDACIFRVPHQVRKANERAYEPQLISIGPYHRGKDHLRAMEAQKFRCLKGLLQGPRISSLTRYEEAMRAVEEQASSCYAEPVRMSSNQFVQMMILDGCFIVQLIYEKMSFGYKELPKRSLNLTVIAQDLLLLENQLPFFVLEELFHQIADGQGATKDLPEMAVRFSRRAMLGHDLRNRDYDDAQEIKHLLHLIHESWLPSPQALQRRSEAKVIGALDGVFDKMNFLPSATDLLEVGIQFMKYEGGSGVEIKFEKGKLQIPTFRVDHYIERILCNFIAHEQYIGWPTVVIDFVRLMGCLIKSSDDVALLSDCGIIDNLLGSNEDVAHLFNRLNDNGYSFSVNVYYCNIFEEVNERYNRRLNLWKVKLRNKYFHTRWYWVGTSIMAAIVLLILTVVQTEFSVLAYFK